MFQSGQQLETIFSSEAVFYRLEVKSESHLCRSVAAIHRKELYTEAIDALFVLLNPGKCLPVEGEESVSILTGDINMLPMVPAVPDNTMHQMMRLMERMEWNHVQVINLTDLRTGKFEEYAEKQALMARYGDSRHTIFSSDRYPELLDRAESAEVIIAGWGTKSQIKPVAIEANSLLWEIKEVKGLRYKEHPLYYHPFPWLQTKCAMWLDNMEEQLKKMVEVV